MSERATERRKTGPRALADHVISVTGFHRKGLMLPQPSSATICLRQLSEEIEMLHDVKDLSPEQRRAVETLLGRTVAEDESVSIKGIRPSAIIPSRLSSEERREALGKLRGYFAKVDARRAPISESEEEEIIKKALRSTRLNYRPIH